MATDFSRTLSLLRKDKGVSQRNASAALGISQALLSHYENGIREPGLAFVIKACNYYHVSADYLLGRTMSRDGTMIDADDLYDSSHEKGTLRGSIMATLQKKLVVNTTSLLFNALGKLGNRKAIIAAGSYLSGALYYLLRQLFRRAGGNEDYFCTSADVFDSGAVSAHMELSRMRYLQALDEMDDLSAAFPELDTSGIGGNDPGLSQSAAQVFHDVDEHVRRLTEEE